MLIRYLAIISRTIAIGVCLSVCAGVNMNQITLSLFISTVVDLLVQRGGEMGYDIPYHFLHFVEKVILYCSL